MEFVELLSDYTGFMDGFTEPAISIQHLQFSYEFGQSKVGILNGLNLTVESGTIYGLLGPSGCGKTSLLRCIVGLMYPNKGKIEVYGETPGTVKCQIPGSRVGYMPQELALYQELNITEILNYFGCLHGLSKCDVKKRINFLVELLELPSTNRLIQQLSGGQKRRVSFAIALLHKPPLLILDEPTVGVDPILRESIWNHLIEMCHHEHTTVVITTHYIEEARQGNKIGIMRNGRMIVEENPVVLLNRYQVPTLEYVYLKLCREDDRREDQLNPFHCKRKMTVPDQLANKSKRGNLFVTQSPRRLLALVTKNFIQMRRNLMLLLFQFLLPAIQIVAVCLMIGGDPHDVPVAIYNEDKNYGTKFLQKIDHTTVHQIAVNSYEEGVDLVVNGEAAGVIHISTNFTNALMTRFIPGRNVPDNIVQASRIHLRLDTTNQQITLFLRKAFQQALDDFSEGTVHNIKKYPKIIRSLLEVGEPIYGSNDDKTYTTEFMAAGAILTIVYITAVGLTSLTFIIDRKQGTYERSSVSGVTSFEIMCGYFLTQVGVVVIQVAIVLVLATEVFKVHTRGSLLLVITFSLLHGVCGMTLGFFLSTVCNEESSAVMGSLLIFFPCYAMAGILWPTLGMSNFNQKLSQGLPHTLAVESMRWIMLRGRDLSWTPVWLGLLSTISWTFGFIILSAIVMRIRVA